MKQLDTILNRKEQAVYNGLMTIRPEIAAFYKDGVCFKQMDFLSKSNVLGHLLREIDGGLRSIFESKKKKEDIKKTIDDGYYEKLFNEFKNEYSHYEYLRDVNEKDIKQSGLYHLLFLLLVTLLIPILPKDTLNCPFGLINMRTGMISL